jgi:hypothetical protein
MEKIILYMVILFTLFLPPRVRLTTKIPKIVICTINTSEDTHGNSRGRNNNQDQWKNLEN